MAGNKFLHLLFLTLLWQGWAFYGLAQEITSSIPSHTPQYLNGAPDFVANWGALYAQIFTEIECVDLQMVPGGCRGGTGILWKYRLPVQFVENVPNVGESRYEDPATTQVLYADYELWYDTLELILAAGSGSSVSHLDIGQNQQRRAGLRQTSERNHFYSEAHLWSTDDDIVPAILSFLPKYCTSWQEYPPFKTDVYPNELLWRIPEFTETALPGSGAVTPMECAQNDLAAGKLTPNLLNISPNHSPLAAKTCVSGWGGKIWPLNGQSYAPSKAAGRALNTRKAIELAPFALQNGYVGSMSHPFNDSKDRLQMHYPNKSSCFRIGENPSTWNVEPEDPSKEDHHVFIHWKYRTCCT